MMLLETDYCKILLYNNSDGQQKSFLGKLPL